MAENVFDKAKINDDEWELLRISNAANRPNAKTAYGPGKNAKQTKGIFDAPLDELKEKHNELLEITKEVEAERQAAEAEKEQAESERQSTFEENEQVRQKTFEDNETERASDYVAKELNRGYEFRQNEDARQAEFDAAQLEREEKFSEFDLVQGPGDSTTKAMSQDATTRYVPKVATRNLMTLTFENKRIDPTSGELSNDMGGQGYAASPDFLTVEGNTEYILSWVNPDVEGYIFVYEYEGADYETHKGIRHPAKDSYYGTRLNQSMKFKTNAATKTIRISFWGSGLSSWEELIPDNFQMEKGTVATEYVPPFIIDPSQISFGEEIKKSIVSGLGKDATKAMSQNSVTELYINTLKGKSGEYCPELEQGTYDETPDLHKVDGRTDRVRTVSPIFTNKEVIGFNIPSNIQVWVYDADLNLSLAGNSGSYLRGSEDNMVVSYQSKGDFAVLVFRWMDDSTKNITPADVAEAGFRIVYSYEQKRDAHSITIPMERGKFGAGAYKNEPGPQYRRSAFLTKINGATYAVIDKPKDSEPAVYYYGRDMKYLGYDQNIDNNLTNIRPLTSMVFKVMDGAEYIRFHIVTTDNEIIEHTNAIFIGATEKPTLVKNIQISTENEKIVPEKIVFDITAQDITTSRLILPPNYDPVGDPVPLVLWMDGSGNFASWNASITNMEVKKTALQYLADEGFAVFSVFAWGKYYLDKYPTCGNAFPYPVPTNINAIKKGLEYITDRFNIDPDNVHVMSKSQGGAGAIYFASNPIWNFRSIGAFAPVVDYLSMPGEKIYADTRRAINEELNFIGSEFFCSEDFTNLSDDAHIFYRRNAAKLAGFNQAWTGLVGGTLSDNLEKAMADGETYWNESRWNYKWKDEENFDNDKNNSDIYNHTEYKKIAKIPVKIWGAPDDAAAPYGAMVEVVAQLQNGGTEAHMRSFERGTGAHMCADAGTVTRDVTTKLNIEYTDLPIGWYENVLWMREKMPKCAQNISTD